MAGSIAKLKHSGRGWPQEWLDRARDAREVRSSIGAELADYIREADMTGSREFVALRIRSFANAEASGDAAVVRAALADLATAVGAYMAAIDLGLVEGLRQEPRPTNGTAVSRSG